MSELAHYTVHDWDGYLDVAAEAIRDFGFTPPGAQLPSFEAELPDDYPGIENDFAPDSYDPISDRGRAMIEANAAANDALAKLPELLVQLEATAAACEAYRSLVRPLYGLE